VCDLETSRMGAPYIYIYDISRLRVKDLHSATYIYVVRRLRVKNSINIKSIKKKCLSRNLHKNGKDSETGKQIVYASNLRIP